MKKVVKIFLFFIILSSFIIPNVYAKELTITNVEVKDKSGTITVEELVITNNTITSNITFNQINDFVTFSIEVDNQEDIPYALESITANENEYLSFESQDINKTILGLSKEKYSVTLKYSEELFNQEELSFNDISIQLNYKVDNSFINPQTNSSIIFYLKIILFSLMIGSLIVLFKQKAYKLLFACFLLIPFICFAEEGKIITLGFNNIKVKGRFLEYSIVIDLGNGEYQTVSEIYGTTIEELPEPEKIGYTFTKWINEDHEEVSTDSIIEGDMQLIPVFEPITYSINYNLGGGTLSTENPETYNIETNTFTLNNPTKQGYNFAGWVEEETGELQTSVTIEQGSINNKTYTATFDARDDTSYTVIHQQQNLNDNNYTTVETQNLTGVTDTSVTPQRRSYTGFTAPAGQTVNINADGSTTVTYQYTRNTYTFSISDRTYVTGTNNGTYKYGYNISVTAQTRAGYTFKWSDNTTAYTKTFTISSNTTLSANYTARTDTPYTVIHQQQNIDDNNYTTVSTLNYTGTTGASITPAVNSYTGFTAPSTQTKTINGDGSTTFTYQYNRISYTLTLNDSNYITTTTPSGSYRYGKSITLTANTREGYTFTKWSDDTTTSTYTFTLTGDKTIGPIYEGNQVNITLNPNGGTLTNTTITKRVGETIGELPTPTPVGPRTFLGWYTALEGGSEVGEDFQVTGAIEIIAKWEYHPEATFDTGSTFNVRLKKLAGNTIVYSSSTDTNIEKIKVADSLPLDFNPQTNNILSISTSDEPIYAWYDSNEKTIYYYSDAETLYLNSDSSEMFNSMEKITFIEGLNNINTSKVTSMSYMFRYTAYSSSSFEMNITNWDTKNVTNMSYMFYGLGRRVSSINIGDISNWNTSKVTNMDRTFATIGNYQTTFNFGSLSNWDVSSVTNMHATFQETAGPDGWIFGDISNWNVSSVTNMSYMFNYAFYSSTSFQIDLSNWKVSSVTNMSNMFSNAGYSDQTNWSIGNLSNWNVSSVTDMSSIFANAGYNKLDNWTLGDLSNWDVSKVTNMSSMFNCAAYKATTWNIGNISNWNVSSVTSMSSMFKSAGRNATTWTLGNLSGWNTASLVNMSGMFQEAAYNVSSITLDLSNWNVSNVTSITSLFESFAYNAGTWSVGNLSSWNTSNVTSISSAFYKTGYNSTTINLNVSNWNLSKVDSTSEIFKEFGYNATNITLNISNWNISNASTCFRMFYNFGYKSNNITMNMANWNLSNTGSLSYMFYCVGHDSKTFTIDVSSWDISNVTNLSAMFMGVGELADSLSLDVTSWTMSHGTNVNMDSMFSAAGYEAKAVSINASGLVTSSVTNIYMMFWSTGKSAESLSIDVSNWDTSNVENISRVFAFFGQDSASVSITGLSTWNTSNVTNMSALFSSAATKTSTFNIDVSSWNTSKVTDMSKTFDSAGKIATNWSIGDLSNWNTSQVTTMFYMFSSTGQQATNWNIGDLSNWNTSSVTDMGYMFQNAGQNATQKTSIGTLNIYATSVPLMFYNSNIKGTIVFHNAPTSYSRLFNTAATANDSYLNVNYTSAVTNIDTLIATKSTNSNVVKGSLITTS